MARSERTTCDWCDADLTFATNCDDYLVELRAVSKKHKGGPVTAMAIDPWPKHSLHFCSENCLRRWIDRGQETPVPNTPTNTLGGGVTALGTTMVSGSAWRITHDG